MRRRIRMVDDVVLRGLIINKEAGEKWCM